MLCAIGLWIQGLRDEKYPAPQEMVGFMSAAERVALVAYLQGGRTHEMYMGYSWCRFGCGIEDASMGSRDLTDGTWVWPQGLAHYVDKHAIVLPEPFVRHALSSPLVVQGAAEWDALHSDPLPVSDALWIEWVSIRRNPKVIECLREAQARTTGIWTARRIERIAELETGRGLAAVRCFWRDCKRQALAKMHVCAEHCSDTCAENDASAYGRRAFHVILEDLTRAYGLVANFGEPEERLPRTIYAVR